MDAAYASFISSLEVASTYNAAPKNPAGTKLLRGSRRKTNSINEISDIFVISRQAR